MNIILGVFGVYFLIGFIVAVVFEFLYRHNHIGTGPDNLRVFVFTTMLWPITVYLFYLIVKISKEDDTHETAYKR